MADYKLPNPRNEIYDKLMPLAGIMLRQRIFSKQLHDFESLTLEEREELTMKYFGLLTIELGEVVNETNYKLHATKRKEPNIQDIQIELIDAFKYLLNLMFIWKIDTPEKLASLFHYKSAIVEARKENKER